MTGLTTNFHEAGFAIAHEIFQAAEISQLLTAIDQYPAHRSRAGVRHAMRLQLVARFAERPELIEMASSILSAGALPFHATLFDKSPAANWLVAWHQDTALPLRERREVPGWGPWSMKEGVLYAHAPAEALSQVVALRVSLDDSLENNGPLRVLPATHHRGVLSDDEILRLAAEIAPLSCVAPCGSVVAMSPLVLHASSKSESSIPRRVLHIEYAASPTVGGGLELTGFDRN